MLVPNQMIEVKWGRSNSTYYKSLGYNFTNLGDMFVVHAEELLPNSKAIVEIICDACGEITHTTYQSYLKSISLHPNGYYCKSCVQKLPEVRAKNEQTTYKKYGETNIFKTNYYKSKAKETNLCKFGVEFPMQSELVKEKVKATIKAKGDEIGFKNKERLFKAQCTLANSGKVPTSSQQLEFYNMLKQKYMCELNKPLNNLTLDIEVNYNGTLIDVEVDGAYWHNNKNKDRRRDEFIKTFGYKILRVRINRTLPDIELIHEGILNLVNSQHSFYQIVAKDVDNN